ncbi:MAG: PIN domain-containing protein [Terracidiphilus sp.]|jgi:predicted nucleic acid-binding protein
MSGKCFVDTDILIYAHDRSAGVKHMRAQMLMEQLWNSGWGVVSTQVLEELCIQLCHNAGSTLPVEEVCLMIHDYSTWDVITPTPALIVEAIEVERRLEVPFWDALILETAKHAGASVLYSENLARIKRYGEIQIMNPLVDQATA